LVPDQLPVRASRGRYGGYLFSRIDKGGKDTVLCLSPIERDCVMELTPVEDFGGWWVKREDAAAYAGPEYPSGSKVRQYAAMIGEAPGAYQG
jgi:hypothetical protein